jgi:hypothetical protein
LISRHLLIYNTIFIYSLFFLAFVTTTIPAIATALVIRISNIFISPVFGAVAVVSSSVFDVVSSAEDVDSVGAAVFVGAVVLGVGSVVSVGETEGSGDSVVGVVFVPLSVGSTFGTSAF